MQTIDLGTISIGSEDIGTALPNPTPCPNCAAKRALAAQEIVQEKVTVESVPSTANTTGSEHHPEHHPDHHPCPGTGDIYFEGCEDYKHHRMGDTPIDGQGRILDLTLRLVNVCPGKRVAVGVTVSEVDSHGNESPCGMKTFTVPAHRHSCCSDVPVETIRFILPEDSSRGGSGGTCGGRRHYVARVSAQYIDSGCAMASL